MNFISIYSKINSKFLTYCLISASRGYSTKPVGVSGALGGSKKKKLGKLGPVMEKKEIPVETDPKKLVNYVCGTNIYKTGDDIKLTSDQDYPEWLFKLNIEKVIPLEELDPNTKQYWRRLRSMALRRNNQLAKLKKF